MIYLVTGEDEFLKDQFIKKIKKSFQEELQNGINYINLSETTIQNIISDIETPAFGFEKKLIIAKNTSLFQKKNAFSDKLSQYLEENSELEFVDIVFVETKQEKNNLYKTIQKLGEIKEFKELKMMELIKQVKSISKAYKVEIKENLAQYLVECVGTNMQTIINELRKLIEYAGENGEIKKEDIDNLAIKNTESVIFELTDNLGKRNIKDAIEILHNLQYQKEPTQVILIMLYRHFRKLYIIHICKGEDVVTNLKLKANQTFLVRKYVTQAKCFKELELKKILFEFINLDENSKNGNINLEIGLEAILCNYCSK